MAEKKKLSLGLGNIPGVFLQTGSHEPLKKKGEELEEKVSSLTGDLMKEHGVIERIMLLYQRLIDKAIINQEVSVSAINRSARIVDDFVSNHHEKDEERYVFPKFREANYIVDIVDTLEQQHNVSRELNGELLRLSSKGREATREDIVRMLELCSMFVEMYLPHISRENTIVFPTFFDIVSLDYIEKAKEKMEEEEEKILGETGFRGLVGRLSEIEKEVGTHDLPQYTAKLR